MINSCKADPALLPPCYKKVCGYEGASTSIRRYACLGVSGQADSVAAESCVDQVL
jgi:hypothetical protein